MKTNPIPINIIHKVPKNHKGFVDSLGKPLAPGDEIIVKGYDRLYHAVIVRFTPKRIYWTPLYLDDSSGDYVFEWDMSTQLHNWYDTGSERHSNPKYHTKAENNRRLRNVMKLDDPAPSAEDTQEVANLLGAVKATRELMEAQKI